MVGAIAYDVPLHRLLVGSGDNSFGGDGISGHGFFTSDNDGATWSTATGFPDLALSFKVVVSPADTTGNTVYVASSKGLFKSSNGGNSFVNENLPTSPAGYTPNCAGDTTTPLCFFANIVTDVVVKGTRLDQRRPRASVMAVVGWRAGQRAGQERRRHRQHELPLNGRAHAVPAGAAERHLPLHAPRSAGHRAASPSRTRAPVPPPMHGFALNPEVGRTALGIAHGAGQNQDAVYALVEDASKFHGCPDVLDTGINPACNGTAAGAGAGDVPRRHVRLVRLRPQLDEDHGLHPDQVPAHQQRLARPARLQPRDPELVQPVGRARPVVQGQQRQPACASPSASRRSGRTTSVHAARRQPHPPRALAGAPTAQAATDPWVVIGRYWNACAALNTPLHLQLTRPRTARSPAPPRTPTSTRRCSCPTASGGVTLFAGSDGGVYSQHIAAGADFTNDNWGDGNNIGLYSLQPYDAEIANDGTVVAGLQDNGEMKIANGARRPRSSAVTASSLPSTPPTATTSSRSTRTAPPASPTTVARAGST